MARISASKSRISCTICCHCGQPGATRATTAMCRYRKECLPKEHPALFLPDFSHCVSRSDGLLASGVASRLRNFLRGLTYMVMSACTTILPLVSLTSTFTITSRETPSPKSAAVHSAVRSVSHFLRCWTYMALGSQRIVDGKLASIGVSAPHSARLHAAIARTVAMWFSTARRFFMHTREKPGLNS